MRGKSRDDDEKRRRRRSAPKEDKGIFVALLCVFSGLVPGLFECGSTTVVKPLYYPLLRETTSDAVV